MNIVIEMVLFTGFNSPYVIVVFSGDVKVAHFYIVSIHGVFRCK